MGGLFSKSDKTNEEILNDLEELNKITNNELFYKKTGYRLLFSKSSHIFKSIIGGKTIICQIQGYKDEKFTELDDKYINLAKFYRVSNAILNSLPIFYRDRITSLISTSGATKDMPEETICPICDDNKITTMLDCYHFFCNDCISTWLIKKRNNCPICRFEIDVKNFSGKKNKNNQWDIVEVDNNDYINETNNILKEAIKDILDS